MTSHMVKFWISTNEISMSTNVTKNAYLSHVGDVAWSHSWSLFIFYPRIYPENILWLTNLEIWCWHCTCAWHLQNLWFGILEVIRTLWVFSGYVDARLYFFPSPYFSHWNCSKGWSLGHYGRVCWCHCPNRKKICIINVIISYNTFCHFDTKYKKFRW